MAGILGWLLSMTAQAQSVTSFTMESSADSVGLEVNASGAPLVENGQDLADVTLSSAQSSLDSLGQSNAFASAPNVGKFIEALPGTVNGLAGSSFPAVPAYPFYVTANYPSTPSASQTAGPYGITAKSTASSANADADIGLSTNQPQVGSATASSSVSEDPNTGILTATAQSDVAPISVSNVLSLGETHSSVTLTFDPNNATKGVKEQSSLSIGVLTIAGIPVGFGPNGLSVAGGNVLPINVSSLNGILSAAGITLQYVPGTKTATSVSTGALAVTISQKVPSLGVVSNKFILGDSSASLIPAAVGQASPSSPSLPASGTATPIISAVPPVVTNTNPATPGSGPTSVSTTGTGAGAGTGIQPPRRVVYTTTTAALPLVNIKWIYPFLAMGGLVALLSSLGPTWTRLRERLESTEDRRGGGL
jgi:hypothetical protein